MCWSNTHNASQLHLDIFKNFLTTKSVQVKQVSERTMKKKSAQNASGKKNLENLYMTTTLDLVIKKEYFLCVNTKPLVWTSASSPSFGLLM